MAKDTNDVWDPFFENYSMSQIDIESGLANEVSLFFGTMFSSKEKGKVKILEVGSGTGELSARLSRDGFNVTLFDQSRSALDLSKRVFQDRGLKGEFIQGNLFTLPFDDNTFDCVWNSGVIEHYRGDEQNEALLEMKRVSKDMIIVAVPNASCLFYRIEKNYQEKIGTWAAGEEYPLATCKEIFESAGIAFLEERYCGWDFTKMWMRHLFEVERQDVIIDKILDFSDKPENFEEFKRVFSYLLIAAGKK